MHMAGVQEYVVSASGQLSLPAPARHRWGLDQGGAVDVLDLGFAVMMLPRGAAKELFGDLVTREQHAGFVASLASDPDLGTS